MSMTTEMRTGMAVALALVAGLFAGCAAPKLTTIQELSDELGLTEAQIRAVRRDIQRIAAAVDDYESDREAYIKAMSGQRPTRGDRGALRSDRQDDLRRLNAKREAYQKVIDRAVDAIAAMLDEGQRKRWADMQKPTLAPPEAPARGGRGDRGGLGGLGAPGGDRRGGLGGGR